MQIVNSIHPPFRFAEWGVFPFTFQVKGGKLALSLAWVLNIILFLFVYTNCWAGEVSFTPPSLSISHPDKKVSSPSIVSDLNGKIYIAWAREDPDGVNIYIAGSLDGKTFGSAVKVNPKGMGMNGIHANPDIAIGQNNEIYVVWSSPRNDGTSASDILFSRSIDNGLGFEEPIIVNDDRSPVSRGFEGIAVGSDGIIHIVWFDGRDNKKDGTTSTYYARSTDGGKTFERNIRVDENTCPCCRTGIAVDDKGNVYVSWRKVFKPVPADSKQGGDVRDIVVARSSDNGKGFSSPVVVSEDRWSIAGCPHRGPSLGTDKDGILYITWYTEGEGGMPSVYFTVSKDNAKTFSKRRPLTNVKSAFPDHPKLAVAQDGRVFFVWEETTPVFSRIFFRYLDGENLSGSVEINDGVRRSHDPVITIDKKGNILIAWSYEEIRFTRMVLKIGKIK